MADSWANGQHDALIVCFLHLHVYICAKTPCSFMTSETPVKDSLQCYVSVMMPGKKKNISTGTKNWEAKVGIEPLTAKRSNTDIHNHTERSYFLDRSKTARCQDHGELFLQF